jgi:hypothetical protein
MGYGSYLAQGYRIYYSQKALEYRILLTFRPGIQDTAHIKPRDTEYYSHLALEYRELLTFRTGIWDTAHI